MTPRALPAFIHCYKAVFKWTAINYTPAAFETFIYNKININIAASSGNGLH